MRKTRWVVKAGSNLVCSGGPLLIRSWMQQVAQLRHKHGVEVIWVTSGAIASGVDRTNFKKTRDARSVSEKQALSAIGQPLLMEVYNIALQASGLLGGQVLLTYDDMSDSKKKFHLQNTLEKLLSWKIVPVLNENDTTATEEIRFGDNDSLSARVACMMNADRLVILTDVDGLYDKDPKKHPNAKLIHRVPRVTQDVIGLAGKETGSSRGTGGMLSKLLAAELTSLEGIESWLVRGDLNAPLIQVAENKKFGTRIDAQKKKGRK